MLLTEIETADCENYEYSRRVNHFQPALILLSRGVGAADVFHREVFTSMGKSSVIIRLNLTTISGESN